jgi:hypothetical protein
MKGKIELHTEMSLDDLVRDLAELPNEKLVALIKELDSTCACYEFTQELRDFFVDEMKKEDEAFKAITTPSDAGGVK